MLSVPAPVPLSPTHSEALGCSTTDVLGGWPWLCGEFQEGSGTVRYPERGKLLTEDTA